MSIVHPEHHICSHLNLLMSKVVAYNLHYLRPRLGLCARDFGVLVGGCELRVI